MIQIDDAGSGSLLGGTIIGVLRVETKEYEYEIIPLKLYSGENFEKKVYIDYVTKIIENIFKKMGVTKDERIEVCRGYMFDKLKLWFDKNNYNYFSTEIKEPLQSIIEKSFEDYAIKLGLPSSFITYTKYPFHFHRILKWVYADYKTRSKLCKEGWKSWKKYSNLEVAFNYEVVKSKNLLCLKCNQPIPYNSTVTVKMYTSNKLNKIYLHNNCI
ncbi:hypothetical protein RH915_01430 [Serpentinicella sp. ANB-PHB4]|uniref:hypothetical protein n=1 Tax=Serpentinicella sp. ANB-PHB4 TaxID=3074076 RepID=UPI0028645EE1|nr:hypothetical protein [Serpentinicella sp. ANB-PHB4]MDR5658141.1 hypothetical protein [Serpentinicella sp. ANB-PHB4]